MRHKKQGRKLKRTASHRSALLSNLCISLILNKRIETTEAKAKELRRFIEPLVSKARKALKAKDSAPEKSIHLRREARKFLNNKEALIILFDEISGKVGDRPGGFTRVLKTSGARWGDGAKTAIIEFVDYNFVEKKQAEQKEKESKTSDTDTKTDKKEAKTEVVKEKKKSVKKESKKDADADAGKDVKKTKTKKKKAESK